MDEHTTQEPKKEISQEDTAKIQWIMQLFSFVKTLQQEIEKRERGKRYIAIFVSGCLTFFIVKILQNLMQSQSDAIVFFGATISLCLHYIVDSFSLAWNQVINMKKFHKSLMDLEKERLNLGITEEDINFGDETKKDK
jgi:Cft2 family RNA processing exonuclease